MDKEKSSIGVLFKNFIVTILLLLMLLLTLVGGTIFLDVIGAINLSKLVPKSSQIAKIPYFSTYLDYSYHQHLSEEDRIRETMNRYREVLEGRRRELEIRENSVNLKEVELRNLEENLISFENKLLDKEEELLEKEERVDALLNQYRASARNIEKFALIYTSMDPASVARVIIDADLETVARIFEMMENRRIASILDALAVENPEKVVELLAVMTQKRDR